MKNLRQLPWIGWAAVCTVTGPGCGSIDIFPIEYGSEIDGKSARKRRVDPFDDAVECSLPGGEMAAVIVNPSWPVVSHLDF